METSSKGYRLQFKKSSLDAASTKLPVHCKSAPMPNPNFKNCDSCTHVPFAIKVATEEEFDKLEYSGVIEKVMQRLGPNHSGPKKEWKSVRTTR